MDEKNRKEYLSVVLGALLHDIGKFMQRAELEKVYPEIENEYEGYCPQDKGKKYYQYLHAAHTASFIEKYIPEGLFDKLQLHNAARHHKNPDGDLYKEADMLSSGMDREKRKVEEDTGKKDYKRQRLYSVFESVDLIDKPKDKAGYRYELIQMGDEPGVAFPREIASLQPVEGALLVPEYMKLWNEFEKEVRNIAAGSVDIYYAALSQLLLKYTWSIPSSTMDIPDISLYDHCKTTAAIAGCIYLYHAPEIDDKAIRNENDEKYVLLVGDLSGIQNYIFNITHIGAGGSAKRLRARSFTVAMIAELVTHKILRAFRLVDAHVLMSSGGKFYLLLPNVPDAEKWIDQVRTETAQWFYENLNAEIGLNVATLKLAGKDIRKFDKVFANINAALQREKQSPFSAILKSDQGWSAKFVLSHAVFDEEEKLCKGCGRLPGMPDEEGKYFCNLCSQDKEIGRTLPKAQRVAFHEAADAGEFQLLGSSFDLLGKGEKIKGGPYLVASLGEWTVSVDVPTVHRHTAYSIPKLTKDDCDYCRDRDCPDKDAAVSAENPMMFQCIANKSKGRKVLGYIKADVDRLGEIIAFGLKGHANSVSRIATMSRMLDLFFSGYVDQMIREKYPHIYTVYSGGDDLLMIGPWDSVIEFAQEMEREFRRFTCNNPSITLSAGVILAKHRMPVFKSVEMAEEALQEAKDKPKDRGRNQLWLFGEFVKWDKVADLVKDSKQLAEWLHNGDIAIGFARNLLEYGRMKKSFDGTRDTRFLKYLPLMTYDIARNLAAPKNFESGIRAWAESLKQPDSPTMKYMGIVASYALTANRGGGNE